MTTTEPTPRGEDGPPPQTARPLGGGWRIVAAKEFTDNLWSSRFTVLLLLVGVMTVGAVQAASSTIRDVADGVSGQSPFLLLFVVSPQDLPTLSGAVDFSFVGLVAFLGPLLGIAFGFDAANNERNQGTLPWLASQPIHRDDVINGKVAAGLLTIAMAVVTLTVLVGGVGIFRLGVVPDASELARLIAFVVISILYIGLWLAFAVGCSVLFRRTASSALIAIAAWLVLTIFGTLLAGALADAIAPTGTNPTDAEVIRNVQVEQTVRRLSPDALYDEAVAGIMRPDVRSVDVGDAINVNRLDRAIPGSLSLPQSLLVVWTQLTVIVSLIIATFSASYVAFMRQEIRA